MYDETKDTLDKMIDFFTVGIDRYEEHILTDGDQEGYRKLADCSP
jgi:hypothetical protein